MTDAPLPDIPPVDASNETWSEFFHAMAAVFRALQSPGDEPIAARLEAGEWILTGGTAAQRAAFRRTAAHAARAKRRYE